jgi:hypothetical protein
MTHFYVAEKTESAKAFFRDSLTHYLRVVHFLPTAEYFEPKVRYPKGQLPSHLVYRPYRDEEYTVPVDCLEQVWTVEDQEVSEIYDALFGVPATCLKDMTRQVMNLNAINIHFANPLDSMIG